MALNDIAEASVNKKIELLDNDKPRFGVRSVLAGVYLTLGTAFAGVAGQTAESIAPGHGLGALVFASLFGLGLFSIVILNTDLATGNMMFASYGTTTGQIGWGKAIWFVFVTTFFNLIGALLVGLLMSQSAKLGDMDNTHLISTLSEGKLDKGPWQAFVEAIGANFVVNMAIVAALYAKDFVSKFFVIIPIIAIFVGLGLEHVIANFSLMSITLFANPLPDNFTVGAIALNWLMVWLGNFVGGGLLIGGVYAWLNKTKYVYKD
ncbi:formate/nitrite transporter family protein [Corynebacterium cystitidis]|uniref:Formate/nitrite transporter n=1 Tax=Corynebacterium cystitidis DSM 20524 TaxID=1121357 RepID=A0A1H9R520_9CORY|nr:formate/nitrite transporter family protein [Corynebacterium cystitidis]WJY81549.1 Nitrite transporter NirC [Corynebacterium cystitidis DSM 20524]SER67780.1 formate/nitrite transporter [Corynebacterium cystitidis DSM 20524]SNV86337.1 transporter protein [Corynebacterium cystitidis]